MCETIGYLKLYQLTKPNLYQYRVILVDEAQDLSPGTQLVILGRAAHGM